MSIEENLGGYFRPEEKKRGEDLAHKQLVMISSASDTGVKAYVKANGNCRVSFSAEDVGSPLIAADCTCTSAKKGNLCRHMWAVLNQLEEKGYDFLADKSEIEKASAAPNPAQVAAAARQAEYKEQRNEQNRARAKDMRQKQKQKVAAPAFSYPEPVEEARAYFAANGCPLPHPLEMEDLNQARKILSRVFHPDKGGDHDEILELNEHFEMVRDYLQT